MDAEIARAKLTHCTACYIDDVCLFTDTFEEHLQALKALLVMLDNVGLRAHPVKCKFACATVEFLGHRVGKHGVAPATAKTAAIMEMGQPTKSFGSKSLVILATCQLLGAGRP